MKIIKSKQNFTLILDGLLFSFAHNHIYILGNTTFVSYYVLTSFFFFVNPSKFFKCEIRLNVQEMDGFFE